MCSQLICIMDTLTIFPRIMFTSGVHSFHVANTLLKLLLRRKITSEKDIKTTVPPQTTPGTVSQGHVSSECLSKKGIALILPQGY